MVIKRIRALRPSGPAVVAFGALFIALSGSAVALKGTNGVNSGDIKNGTIQKKDLTSGLKADVNSGGPAGPQGPAGPTGPAGSGDTFSYQENAGAAASTEVNANGLEVTASCTGGAVLEIIIETNVENALLHVGAMDAGTAEHNYREDDNYDVGEIIDLDAAGGFTNDSEIGQMIYQNPNGGVTTVQYLAEETGGVKQCNFSGSVVS